MHRAHLMDDYKNTAFCRQVKMADAKNGIVRVCRPCVGLAKAAPQVPFEKTNWSMHFLC
jgi:hypothetical protein